MRRLRGAGPATQRGDRRCDIPAVASSAFTAPQTDDVNLPGLVVIPSMMGNKKLYVGTLLADLCSNILAEFAAVVSFCRIHASSTSPTLNRVTGAIAGDPAWK